MRVCGVSCFTGNTQVLLADGTLKEISKIQENDEVIGLDGSINKVLGIETSDFLVGELFSLNGSEFFVTAAHPFMTLKGWKAIDPGSAQMESPEIEIIGELSVGDVLVLNDGKNLFLETIIKSSEIKDLRVYNLLTDGTSSYHVEIQGRTALVYS